MSATLAQRVPTSLLYVLAVAARALDAASRSTSSRSARSRRQDAVYAYPLHLVPHHLSIATLGFFIHSAGIIPALERSVWVLGRHARRSRSRSACRPATRSRASRFRGANALRLTRRRHARVPDHHPRDPAARRPSSAGGSTTRSSASASCTSRSRCRSSILTTASIFSGISVELEEAAMTLGCTRARRPSSRVILPLALPGLAASAIFVVDPLLERGLRRLRR